MEHYSVTYNALYALNPTGKWQIHLQQLNDEDIQPPGHGDNESEGFCELS
jgi:hypothetical protein